MTNTLQFLCNIKTNTASPPLPFPLSLSLYPIQLVVEVVSPQGRADRGRRRQRGLFLTLTPWWLAPEIQLRCTQT